jgi:hypothetical protein
MPCSLCNVYILKPIWFLASPRPNGLMAGREKTKSWLPVRTDSSGLAVIPGLESAEDFPRTKSAEDFTRAK